MDFCKSFSLYLNSLAEKYLYREYIRRTQVILIFLHLGDAEVRFINTRLRPGEPQDGGVGRQGRNLLPPTQGTTTANTTNPKNDLKTAGQTTYTWGRTQRKGSTGRGTIKQDQPPSPIPAPRQKKNGAGRVKCPETLHTWPSRSSLGAQVHNALGSDD